MKSMDEGVVCAIVDTLEPDDEIILNDRSRPLTVLGFEEDRSHGLISGSDYPYHIQWLRGNGTEYRMRWSHTGRYYPTLNSDSELETTESYSIRHGEPRKRTMATSRGERVRRISVVGVDDDDLSAWALGRMAEPMDDPDEAEADRQ